MVKLKDILQKAEASLDEAHVPKKSIIRWTKGINNIKSSDDLHKMILKSAPFINVANVKESLFICYKDLNFKDDTKLEITSVESSINLDLYWNKFQEEYGSVIERAEQGTLDDNFKRTLNESSHFKHAATGIEKIGARDASVPSFFGTQDMIVDGQRKGLVKEHLALLHLRPSSTYLKPDAILFNGLTGDGLFLQFKSSQKPVYSWRVKNMVETNETKCHALVLLVPSEFFDDQVYKLSFKGIIKDNPKMSENDAKNLALKFKRYVTVVSCDYLTFNNQATSKDTLVMKRWITRLDIIYRGVGEDEDSLLGNGNLINQEFHDKYVARQIYYNEALKSYERKNVMADLNGENINYSRLPRTQSRIGLSVAKSAGEAVAYNGELHDVKYITSDKFDAFASTNSNFVTIPEHLHNTHAHNHVNE